MKRAIVIMLAALPFWGLSQPNFKPMTDESRRLMLQADSCLLLNDTYNSMLRYEQACKLTFNDTIVRRLAQCYYKRGQYKRSLHLVDTLLLAGNDYQDLRLRFNCLQRMSAPDSIIAECARQIVSVNQLDAAAVTELISFCRNNKMVDSAVNYGNAYYKIDPTNQMVNKQLAMACYQKHDYYRALDLLLETNANGDDSPSTLYFIGKSYENCAIFDKAFDFMLLAAEGSRFEHLPIVQALSNLALRATGHRDEALTYADIAIELCQADSASLAEIYCSKASFYDGYAFEYREDSVKAATCRRNQIRMLKNSLNYQTTLEAQYRMSLAYNALHDYKTEKKWLKTILDYGWERNKTTRNILSYVDWRINSIEEDLFFEGKKE